MKLWLQRALDSWLAYALFRCVPARLAGTIPLLPFARRPPVDAVHTAKNSCVVVCNGFEHEGAQLSALEIVTGLAEACPMSLTVVGPRPGPLMGAYEHLELCVECIEPPQVGRCSGALYERRLRHYTERLAALEPRLVLVFSFDSFHAVDAAKALRIPSIWAVRESGPPKQFFRKYPYALQQRAMACLRYPAAVSSLYADLSSDWPEGPILKIIPSCPNKAAVAARVAGVREDARRKLGLDDERFVLLCVATVCEGKDQLTLLEALLSLKSSRKTYALVLVGRVETTYRKGLEAKIKQLRAETGVKLLVAGNQACVGDFYSAADAYVSASASEGAPRSLFEALAAGLPMFVSDITAHRLLLEKVEACFHQSGDYSSLAEQLDGLDAEQIARMAQSSRKRWEHLSGHVEMIEEYRSLLSHVDDLHSFVGQQQGS